MKRHNLTIPQWFLTCPYLETFSTLKTQPKCPLLKAASIQQGILLETHFKKKQLTFQKMELINIMDLRKYQNSQDLNGFASPGLPLVLFSNEQTAPFPSLHSPAASVPCPEQGDAEHGIPQ